MTSTLCQSAALDRIIAPWPAKIAMFFHTIVETLLTIAEIVRTTLDETMGRHAWLLRHRTGFLPPSAAPARIADNRKVDLHVSSSAQMREAGQATSPQVLLDRSREEQPAETNGDEGEESSWISKSLRLAIQDACGRACPYVKCSCGFAYPLSATEH